MVSFSQNENTRMRANGKDKFSRLQEANDGRQKL